MVRTISLLSCSAIVTAQDLFLQPLEAAVDASGVHTCVKKCLADDQSKHYKSCEKDGATDCSKSKCCKNPQETCFVKNPYWSSCQLTCEPGHKDSEGEKWDCTAIAPTGCIHLQACMDGCHSLKASNSTVENLDVIDDVESEDDPELAVEPVTEELQATGDPSKCTGGDLEMCKAGCKQKFTKNNYTEHLCEVLCDKNCPKEPKVCPNKKGLVACLSDCKDNSKASDSGSKCEKDGATSCLHSKCCQMPGAKCYTKNKYWAACTGECTPGKPSKLDNMIWDCKELKGKQVCDSAMYRKCANTCSRFC